jgi:hypothetical protein
MKLITCYVNKKITKEKEKRKKKKRSKRESKMQTCSRKKKNAVTMKMGKDRKSNGIHSFT